MSSRVVSGFTCAEQHKKKSMKLSRLKKKRLIIRNLSFKVNEEELKKIFSKFGEILQVNIPLKTDGKKKGFAFIEFSDTKSMIKAMKELNFQKIHGRPVAIDFAINKNTYLSQQKKGNPVSKRPRLKREMKFKVETDNSDGENVSSGRNNLKQEIKAELKAEDCEDDDDDERIKCESESRKPCDNMKTENDDDDKVKVFLKEFDADDNELQENLENETSSESSEDEEDESIFSNEHDNHTNRSRTKSKPCKKKHSEDVAEGKTVFIRNISFKCSEKDLQEVVEEFGDTLYCLFCIDPVTDHFRGTAFVKFKKMESAKKLIEESSKEPGILLDGRRLLCTVAVSPEELSKQRDDAEKNKNRKNRRVLKCGRVGYGSKESKHVSETDLAKRAQEPGMLIDGHKLLCTAAVNQEKLSKHRVSEKNKNRENQRLIKCGRVRYGFKKSKG